jgi:hypothetical protein
VFESKFRAARGQPIEHNGKMIRRVDYFKLPQIKTKLHIKFVETHSEWLQGIELSAKGYFDVANQRFEKGVLFWEHTAPKEFSFEVNVKDRQIIVMNIWDTGNGVKEKWYHGAALYFEEIPGGKRYYCNDGHPNDDFTDLIFELTVVS